MAERIKVWDIAVRVFHWSLVGAFALAWLTAEDESALHTYAGYTVAGLIVFRLLWGFIGGRYARFKAFLYSPGETLAYIRDSWNGKSRHYLSHNPLGALMVFALLLSLTGAVITGLALNSDLPGQTLPEQTTTERVIEADNDHDSDDDNEAHSAGYVHHEQWEEVHEFFANLTIMLVVLHVLGVAMASRFHKEKLVPAMFTGWKEKSGSPH